MKRLATATSPRELPSFGDYRRMRLLEPYHKPLSKEEDILKKAVESEKSSAKEFPEPNIEDQN